MTAQVHGGGARADGSLAQTLCQGCFFLPFPEGFAQAEPRFRVVRLVGGWECSVDASLPGAPAGGAKERARADGTRSVRPLRTAASPSPIGRLKMEHRHSRATRSTRQASAAAARPASSISPLGPGDPGPASASPRIGQLRNGLRRGTVYTGLHSASMTPSGGLVVCEDLSALLVPTSEPRLIRERAARRAQPPSFCFRELCPSFRESASERARMGETRVVGECMR